MRTHALVLLAACSAPRGADHQHTAPPQQQPVTPPSTAPAAVDNDAPQGEIVTAQLVELNSPKYGRPPTKFRTGSVAAIPAPKPKKTASGYEVKFASSAAITTPTVYRDEVIVSGGFNSKQLFAYAAKTGEPRWGIDLHDDGPSASACEDNVCVINTESCTIFAVAADTGKQLWSYWLGDPLTSAPTIAKGRVFSTYPASTPDDGKPAPPGANHVLAAFDLKSGQIDWQLWLDGDVMSAPVAMNDFVYVTTFAGTILKVEQATGKIRYAMKAKATSAPVVQFDGSGVEQMYYTRRGEKEGADAEEMIIRADHNEPKTVYKTASKKAGYIDHNVQSKSAHAAKASAEDSGNGFSGGAPASASPALATAQVGVSSVQSMQGFQGSRVLRVGSQNVNTMGDEVIATDSASGKQLWSHKLSGNAAQLGGFLGTAPLATHGGAILVGTLDGAVVKLDPKTGTPVARFTIGSPVRSQPVVDAGWIYVGTDDGRLVAIQTADPTITGWPTWGGDAQRTGVAH